MYTPSLFIIQWDFHILRKQNRRLQTNGAIAVGVCIEKPRYGNTRHTYFGCVHRHITVNCKHIYLTVCVCAWVSATEDEILLCLSRDSRCFQSALYANSFNIVVAVCFCLALLFFFSFSLSLYFSLLYEARHQRHSVHAGLQKCFANKIKTKSVGSNELR